MKTKDLIKELQEADPSGEIDVCVDNIDIYYVNKEPAYWDGSQQVLIRDKQDRAIGGKYKRSGNKIQISLLPFSTLIWDNKDAFMDYSDLGEDRQKEYKENHDKIRQSSIDFDHELELEYFTKHIKSRIKDIPDDVIKEFYQKNINPWDKIPDDIDIIGKSYIDRRNIQWYREIEIDYIYNCFRIKKNKENL